MSPLYLLFSALTLVQAAPATDSLLPRVFNAVDKAIKFFSKDYSEINVDGLFGLRIGQGQILEAIRECETRQCPEEVRRTLRGFHEEMSTACEHAMPYLEEASPDYFERFKQTIDKPYQLAYRPIRFHGVEDVIVGTDHAYNEEEGDACYARLMGTFKEGQKNIPRCNITQPCLDLMTRGNTNQYTITHQLLYFIVVEHTGCDKELSQESESLSKEGIRELEDTFCKKIYKEARSYAEGGQVDIGHQDLFLEQTVLCGALGYEDFLKPSYIEMVLKMQAQEGCFKMGMEQESFVNDVSHLFEGRKLLREKPMADGCLSHKSGLGIGTLSLYLRYLVRSSF